jgi:hypothetical protein
MSKNYCISALKPLNYYIFSNGLLQFYEYDIKCTESFQLKSDNKSKYSIQNNYNEKK